MAEGTPDAVFVKDRDGKYLLFNRAAAGFVGKPISTVLGRDDTALFNSEDARRVMERDRLVMTDGQPDTREEVLTAAGETRVYLATKAPYRDGSGNVIGVIGISRDITDRRRAGEALSEQRDWIARIADTAPGVIFSCRVRPNGETTFPYVSPRITDIYGTPGRSRRRWGCHPGLGSSGRCGPFPGLRGTIRPGADRMAGDVPGQFAGEQD